MFKPKRSKDRIEEIRRKITEVWGKIYYKPMSTIQFFEEIKENYKDVYNRDMIYRDLRECQKDAEKIFEAMIEPNNNTKFKQWMDHCWLHKIPYIILVNGIAKTPKTFKEWQRDLSMICIKKLYGVRQSMFRMGYKDMDLVYYLTDQDGNKIENQSSIKDLLSSHNKTLKLLGDKEEGEKEDETD